MHYCTQNTHVWKEVEAKFIVIPDAHVSAVQKIIDSYPNYLSLSDLPDDSDLQNLIHQLAELQILCVQ